MAFRREINKRGAIASHALAVDVSQAGEKSLLGFAGLGRKQPIDEAIDQRLLRAGRIRFGQDHIAQSDQGFILVRVQENGLPIRSSKIL